MTRTLPWLKDEPRSRNDSGGNARKRQRISEVLEDTPTAEPSFRRRRVNQAARTPSTSPPPEPPSEEFMLEGLARDDAYIMVEDEFNAVAKLFTQHLHHAEYVRLKNEAKSRNASTIQSVSRPVDTTTKMPVEAKRQIAAKAKSAEQHKALDQLARDQAHSSDLDEDQDDDPWVGTSLHGLMTSPRKAQRLLSKIAEVKSNTKTTPRYQKSDWGDSRVATSEERISSEEPLQRSPSRNEESTDSGEDDDLDAAPPKNAHPSRQSTSKPISRDIPQRDPLASLPPIAHSPSRPPDRPTASSIQSTSQRPKRSERVSSSSTTLPASLSRKEGDNTLWRDSFDDVPKRSTLRSSHLHRTTGRTTQPEQSEKGERGRKEDSKRRTALLQEIPIFL